MAASEDKWVRVPKDLVESAEALRPGLEARIPGVKWSGATIIRFVIARGLQRLERQIADGSDIIRDTDPVDPAVVEVGP